MVRNFRKPIIRRIEAARPGAWRRTDGIIITGGSLARGVSFPSGATPGPRIYLLLLASAVMKWNPKIAPVPAGAVAAH